MSNSNKKKKNSTSFKKNQSGNLKGRTPGIKDARAKVVEIKKQIDKALPNYSLIERQRLISDSMTKFLNPKYTIEDYEKEIEKVNKNPSKISVLDSLVHIILDEAINKKDRNTRQFLFTQILQNPVRAVQLADIKKKLKKIISDIRKEWSSNAITVDHVADLYLDVSTEFVDDPEVYGMVQQLFKGLLDFIVELEKLNLEKTKVEYSKHNSVTINKLNDILMIVNKNLQRHLIDLPEVYEKVHNNINAEIGKSFISYTPGELPEKEVS